MAHERPQRPWLFAHARAHLRAAGVPADCRPGLVAPPSGVWPGDQPRLLALFVVGQKPPAPRAKTTRLRIGAVLTWVARALLAGRREIAASMRFAQPLHPRRRRLRGLPVRKGTPALGGVPGSGVFAAGLGRLDHEKFAALLGDWPLAHAGTLPQALAMDGKIIRVHLGLLTLAQHEDNAPPAVAAYDQKEGAGRGAQVVATALPEKLPGLDGKLLTAAALPCQKANARVGRETGGEDLFQIKGVRPGWHALAQALAARPGAPFLSGRRVATVEWKVVPSPRGPSRRAPSRSPSPAASMWSAVRRRTGKGQNGRRDAPTFSANARARSPPSPGSTRAASPAPPALSNPHRGTAPDHRRPRRRPRYGAYFPADRLKEGQDWFDRYREEPGSELKPIRNALDQFLASARFAEPVQRHARQLDGLVSTHRLIAHRPAERKTSAPNPLTRR